MSKLLFADAARLFKSRLLWIIVTCVVGVVATIIGIQYVRYLCVPEVGKPVLDNLLFDYYQIIGIGIALFISLFISTDFSDGVIRNKIVAGCTRKQIYFSNLIISIIGILFVQFVYLATVFIFSLMIQQNFEITVFEVLKVQLVGIASSIALSSIYLAITMLIANKTNAVVINCIIAFALNIVSMYIITKLYSQSGETLLTGLKGNMYSFLDKFIPTCQINHMLRGL